MSKQQSLVDTIQKLSLARTLNEVVEITRHAARELTGADGATFVLRENDFCHYVDEDAITPLWKGKRFPIAQCVSGWAMIHKEAVMIKDIYQDARIPIDAYSPTFIKSLLMVPIRESNPIGAIGNYWAAHYTPTEEQVQLLRTLANSTATALENIQLVNDLESAKRSLESSLRSRDEFLSVISHELRTPISVLQLQLQMMERTLKKQGQESAAIDMTLGQIGELNQLVEKLLDVSRIQLNRLMLHYKELNFSEVVRTSVEKFRPQLEATGCILQTEFDESIRGEWDEARLQQIVINLLANIRKYAAGTAVKITTRLDSIGQAVLEIQDQGRGIAPEVQEHIFDRFERGVSARNVSGLGLGLFLTKSYVTAHEGTIRVQSSGEGTTFIIELPAKRIVTEDKIA